MTDNEIKAKAVKFVEFALEDDSKLEVVYDYENATGYWEREWFGYSWRYSPGGENWENEDDELFWEMIDDLLTDNDWSLLRANEFDGIGQEVGRERWLADTWNELTPDQQDRFIDYS